MAKAFRVEEDFLGKVKVPANALYGAFTVRAIENFGVNNNFLNDEILFGLIKFKWAAALANAELGVISKRDAGFVVRACKKILSDFDSFRNEFPVCEFQAGAGTASHMNVNEVIASLASSFARKKIDAHDVVNASQSSNDVFPSVVRFVSFQLVNDLIPVLVRLSGSFLKKSREFSSIVKSGRTHLMDALPVSFGQEFFAYSVAIDKRVKVLKDSLKFLKVVPIGGTAVGSGVNAPKNFGRVVIKHLKGISGVALVSSSSKMVEEQFMSDLADVMGALSSIAIDLTKVSRDLRLGSSGPVSGLNEVVLPSVEPGSSIMPFKVNPSILEMVEMVCLQVRGNAGVVGSAAASGDFELNVMAPLIGKNMVESLISLNGAIKILDTKCVSGIKINEKVAAENFESNPILGTVLNKVVGYDEAARLIKEAVSSGDRVSDVAVRKGVITKKESERLFSKKNLRLN